MDLNGWTKSELVDDSGIVSLQARSHGNRVEAAVQGERDAGASWSDLGALPQARLGTALPGFKPSSDLDKCVPNTF
ncbi:hypothetical protein SBBP2_2380004 [Burkholderiales bacterium]|nr:hypothetical protein SBBP2_2380004 [Burkholderiales bacterium]